jgi:hypothetical protein
MRRLLLIAALVALLPALSSAQEEDGFCPTPAAAPFLGGAGDDTFEGTGGDDRIHGAGGADRINGLAGNDCLTGGEGGDALAGGDGNDRLSGDLEGRRAGAADTLDGGIGDDALDGGGADDALRGGDGKDQLRGGFGDDMLFGGAGDDTLDGNSGADRLDGGVGNDRLSAEGGAILGGEGDDQISAKEVTVDAGAGADTVKLSRGHTISVALGDGDDRGTLADGVANDVLCGAGTDTVTIDRRDRPSDCETVTRRAMPDPRVAPRTGRAKTTFVFTFASPIDYSGGIDEGSESYAVEIAGPAKRCDQINYELRRARRGGARERVRLKAPGRGWCKGRYTAQLWYRTYQIGSSCDSGDLTDEECRGTDTRIGEAVTFRVR